jgi:ATP-binding cassette subfamily B protein
MKRPVIIIDDGLSAVDTDTEHQIIANFKKWLSGRTCIIVSHRVAPILKAREILVIDKGRITGRGRHRELLDANPFYRTIYEHQMSVKKSGEAPR